MLCNTGAYVTFRWDRKHRPGGGICVLVNSAIPCVQIQLKEEYIDLISNDKNVRIIAAYRPSPTNMQNDCVTILCKCIRELLNVAFPSIVAGDFNFPEIDWESCSGPEEINISVNNLNCNSQFLNCCLENGLHQYVTEATQK